jgi:hypothetical protein
MEQAATAPVLKRGNSASVAITDQYPFLIFFPNYFNLLFMTKFCIISILSESLLPRLR